MKANTEYNAIITADLNYHADPSDFEPITEDEMDELFNQLMDEAIIHHQMRAEQIKEATETPIPIPDLYSDEVPF